MHVKCVNQYKTGADREHILGQPMLFVCMGICVLSSAHDSEMRGYLDCQNLISLILFKLVRVHIRLDGLSVEFWRDF